LAMAREFTKQGHRVYIFGSPETRSPANIVEGETSLLYEKFTREKSKAFPELEKSITTLFATKDSFERDLTLKAFKMAHARKLDIIHSYHDSLAHYFDELSDVPVVYTLHDPMPPKNSIEHWRLNKFKHHNFISISKSQRGNSNYNWVGTVLHGIDVGSIPFIEKPDSYMAFMGRFAKTKGIETAVSVAKKTNTKLKAAGKSSNEAGNRYFEKTLKPLFKKNSVKNLGMILGNKRFQFLGKARAVLFPIQWEEPFGLVMVEAMASGTPVIAFNRGSVPEVIKHGKTGFIVKNEREMIAAVKKIYAMPAREYGNMRKQCRKHVEKQFSAERMAENYENLYYKVIAKNKKR
jgi:glycosyltransferase involved in cell wall biosynthesis